MFECIRCQSTSWSVRNLMDDLHGYCTCNVCGTHQKVHEEVKEEPKHLYTPTDVAKVRKILFDAQAGFDPILQQPIDIKGAVVDHDHTSQRVRAVLHRQTNSFEGVVQRAYTRYLSWMTEKDLAEVLENLAKYYRRDYSKNPIHPGWLKKSLIEFRKLSAGNQADVLKRLGSNKVCINKSEREKELKKLQKRNTFENIMKEIWRHLED